MNWRSILFYFASMCLISYGLFTMYHYGNYDEKTTINGDRTGHIVGGDAYNFIIIGIRGVGLILCGLLSTLIGGVIDIVNAIGKNKQ